MTGDPIGEAIRIVLPTARPTRRPRHPETGCPCDDCTRRDDALEARAVDRAAERSR